MLRPSRRRLADQSAFTLVELLVVMVLMGVVGGIVLRSFVAASSITSTGAQRADGLEDIRPAIQRMTRELRAADPIRLSSTGDYDTDLSAVVRRDGTTSRHHFQVTTSADGIELWEEVFAVADDGTETLERANALVILVDASTRPVFTYLDLKSEPITCTDLNLSDATDDATCRSRLVTASAIGISLTRDVVGQSPIIVTTAVNIRNVRYES